MAMPQARKEAIAALAGAIAGGDVDLGPGADWQAARQQLARVPGLGPWTTEVIALRGLGDPDAFPATDLGVRHAANALGLPGSPAALTRRAEPWRPWRGYAVQYLWATSDHAINRLPPPITAGTSADKQLRSTTRRGIADPSAPISAAS